MRRTGEQGRTFACRQATRAERRRAGVLLAIIVVALIWLAANNPAETRGMPSCPTRAVLGFECPGCGSTRATHHLLNARLADAWRHNPAMVLVGIPLGLYFIVGLVLTLFANVHIGLNGSKRLGVLIAAVLIAYMIVRNLPIDAFESLRPPTES